MSYIYLLLYQFAATYNCGTYGSGGFNEDVVCLTSGGLSDTGTSVVVGIGVGIVLIAIAFYIMIKNHKKK